MPQLPVAPDTTAKVVPLRQIPLGLETITENVPWDVGAVGGLSTQLPVLMEPTTTKCKQCPIYSTRYT